MAKSIRGCIEGIKNFPKSLKEKLLNLNDKFKEQGMDDVAAGTEAALVIHKELHEDLNDLKRHAGLSIKKYSRPQVSEAVNKVQDKYSKIEKQRAFEAAQKEREEAELNALTEGKVVFPQEGMTNDDFAREVLHDSENPAQIAATYLGQSTDKAEDDVDGQDSVYRFFKEGGRLSKAALGRVLHTKQIRRLDFPGIDSYMDEKKGLSEDAGETERYGFTIDDVANFIGTYPRGLGQYEEKINKGYRGKLAGKFQKLTKKKLTKGLAEKLAKKHYEQYGEDEKAFYNRPISEVEANEETEKEKAKQEYEKSVPKDDQYQKSSQIGNESLKKVVEAVQKALPKFKVVYNADLDAAGKISGNTIEINPFYAGKDTPIHEAGHALIDFIGYENKVIQRGIKQLQGTAFWDKVAKARPELSGEMLAKEVLAEAIGIEGAGIFESEAQKSRFKQVLDYVFTRLKQLLGIDKNIAKSLAKQIIGGIGTKEVGPEKAKAVKFQMPSGEIVNGKEVQVDVVNGFYSNLEKQLSQIKLDKIPAKQWADKLKGEEAKWTGLIDWLNAQQGSVSKKDIQQFLKDNRIQIVEVEKGGEGMVFDYDNAPKEVKKILDKYPDDPHDAKEELERIGYSVDVEMDGTILSITKGEKEPTKFHEYQLEGKKSNYKEVLVTMPRNKPLSFDEYRKEAQKLTSLDDYEIKAAYKNYLAKGDFSKVLGTVFKSSHFDEPNILVHLRMNTRTDSNGNKVLFLEEVQSDWGQKGKKEGFGDKNKKIYDIANGLYQARRKGDKELHDRMVAEAKKNNITEKEISDAQAKYGDFTISRPQTTPEAPFVTDTNSWVKLGLKVALKEAVKQGVDKIAWTTGEQQNDRYDLSKTIKKIRYDKNGTAASDNSPMWEINIETKEGRDVDGFYRAEEIEGVVGKEIADKIINSESKSGEFSGLELKVGGKGMIGFYGNPKDDSLGIIGNVAKKVFNQEPQPIKIKDVGTQYSVDVTPELVEVVGGGLPMFQKKKGNTAPLTEEQKKIKQLYEAIKDIEDLSAVPYEDMVDAYNYVVADPEFSRTQTGQKAKREFLKRMGMNFFQRYSDKVKTDPKYSKEAAAKTDISGMDVMFKALSHFTAEFPELKGLSELFDKVIFKKVTESTAEKRTNQKLAEAVIRDYHKKQGVVERAAGAIKNLIGNRNYRYFDFLEGKNGNFITVDEAKKKGLSKAQIDYLKFVRNTVAARGEIIDNLEDNWNSDMQVLKTDKRFYENFSTENTVTAFSSLLGNTWNINNTRINFTNPNTGKEQTAEYEQVEKILSSYAEKGLMPKMKALFLMAKYNLRARKQLAKNVNVDEKGEENVLNAIRSGDYSLTQTGKLVSKFDKKRNPNRPYSKDFYSAINEYIDDNQHIKHLQPIVPIINAIDYINSHKIKDADGNVLHDKKDNVTQWLRDWSDLHILKKPGKSILNKYDSPELGATLKFFRGASSLTMMMFNVPAQLRNIAMGVYNTWRQENGEVVAKGNKRLFGDMKYAYELIKKYRAVSTDLDSNPIRSAGGVIAGLGYAGTKWGEFLVQGTQFLGLIDEKDYKSFEWKKNKFGVDELVPKSSLSESEKDALEKRMLDHVNSVSDVQGKYSDKDRRNIQNNELGKSIMQFRVWMPDWWRIRFSEDAGSLWNMFGGEINEMKRQIAEKGHLKAFWQDKAFMSNLKDVSMIVLLMSLLYDDDDDDKKSFASQQGMKVLSEMTGVVDPNNAKQILERPIASMGVVTRLLDMADHLLMFESDDFYKANTKNGEKGSPKIIGDVKSMIPGKKAYDTAEELLDEE